MISHLAFFYKHLLAPAAGMAAPTAISQRSTVTAITASSPELSRSL
jgi:hypothetical protein